VLHFTELDARRKAACALFDQSASNSEISRVLGVSRVSVLQWRNTYRQGGLEALRAKRRGRPPRSERMLSDDNPETNGLGEAYDVDLDSRLATSAHPVEEIEPEETDSPRTLLANKMRAAIAFILGTRFDPYAIAVRFHAVALLTSHTVFNNDTIEAVAQTIKGRQGKPITKQALAKAISAARKLLFNDIPLINPHLRSAKSKEKMRAAMLKSHARRLAHINQQQPKKDHNL
jgi:transposase-like protein